ncbi:hypothetical protein MARPO_0120s0040 [Marchantia polymorpha]|uniref:Uncharacterized protein n=1 Tax=Marchantia polymorpha TaxID=3197 RepID=A0A2R6WAA5_MARPO|nr:hypothetical protein MARPO_0120s0040 [Marchantia polymorpha]|eukprot:PTQ30764.1 hypothetical protein MARPO_0120s0040 [Marchantia polymorpha]
MQVGKLPTCDSMTACSIRESSPRGSSVSVTPESGRKSLEFHWDPIFLIRVACSVCRSEHIPCTARSFLAPQLCRHGSRHMGLHWNHQSYRTHYFPGLSNIRFEIKATRLIASD